MDPILANLIANFVVPEVMDLVKRYHAQHDGKWPSEAEVLAELPRLSDMYVQAGESFLHRNDLQPIDQPVATTRKRARR